MFTNKDKLELDRLSEKKRLCEEIKLKTTIQNALENQLEMIKNGEMPNCRFHYGATGTVLEIMINNIKFIG